MPKNTVDTVRAQPLPALQLCAIHSHSAAPTYMTRTARWTDCGIVAGTVRRAGRVGTTRELLVHGGPLTV